MSITLDTIIAGSLFVFGVFALVVFIIEIIQSKREGR